MQIIHVLQLFHAALLAAALWASRLRWFLVDALVSSCPPHASLPAHVGVIIGVDEADDLVRVARVVRWCADAGINRLTLCDPRGDLLRSVDALRAALTSHCIADLGADLTQPAAAGSQTAAAPRMKLGVVSPQGGRSELVDAARSLCVRAQAGRVSPRSIDEGAQHLPMMGVARLPDTLAAARRCGGPSARRGWRAAPRGWPRPPVLPRGSARRPPTLAPQE